jgi:4-amino-4-deoxy-L-arabinose transferase-like glycosyltransferase
MNSSTGEVQSETSQQRPIDTRMDTVILVLLAASLLVLHIATNGRYGFHPDELATADDARHLAWGYVVYPPITPALARVSLELFGPSARGLRFFSALAQAIAALLSGLIARELGGKRLAQIVAFCAVAISPMALASGTLLQYVALDYLCWVTTAYFLVRLLRTQDPRWWLAIGSTIGLGMLTKYTMIFPVAGIAAGVLLTNTRRYLKSPWLWGGVAVSLLIFSPNLIWQVHHDFISLDFLRQIHTRDISRGFTQNFLPDQLLLAANVVSVPLWIAGLYFYFFKREGERFRPIGLMAVVTFLLLYAAKGRGYYAAPLYPMLIAAGAVVEERWLASLSHRKSQILRMVTFAALAVGGLSAAAVTLPLAPVRSKWWGFASRINGNFREQVGWPDLVAEVAAIRDTLPPNDQRQVAILTTTYGEAAAIDMYGGAYGLPKAISGVNNYWARGYGNPPPQVLIVLGMSATDVDSLFESCLLAGRTMNSYRVVNDETKYYPSIFICRNLRYPWPRFWDHFHLYG